MRGCDEPRIRNTLFLSYFFCCALRPAKRYASPERFWISMPWRDVGRMSGGSTAGASRTQISGTPSGFSAGAFLLQGTPQQLAARGKTTVSFGASAPGDTRCRSKEPRAISEGWAGRSFSSERSRGVGCADHIAEGASAPSAMCHPLLCPFFTWFDIKLKNQRTRLESLTVTAPNVVHYRLK